ncbi:hypothetical protein JRG19_08390 [Pseudoclavibacter alba]|uniref:hypothetical protein n=1 Tax=Pseudoclavibacter albus TaxID=272241 RepID=UPI0019D07F06|nr:hypothetical protein [Pseudoclavibacter alba]MBN6778557.1 hypothetical protein [Pseudoclavibacter alba]
MTQPPQYQPMYDGQGPTYGAQQPGYAPQQLGYVAPAGENGKSAWMVSLFAFIPFLGFILWPIFAIMQKSKLAARGGAPAAHGRGGANFALTYIAAFVIPLALAIITMAITSAVLGQSNIRFDDAPVSFVIAMGSMVVWAIAMLVLGITYWVNLFVGMSKADRGEPFEGYLVLRFFKG